MKLSITQTLKQAALLRGERPAIHFEGRETSYPQLIERVARLAGGMRASGVQTGDRIGLLALNSDRYLETLMAIWWVGAVANPVNIRWSVDEIAYSLDDCETRMLIVDHQFAAMVPTLRERSKCLQQVVSLDSPVDGSNTYEAWLAMHDPIADTERGGEDLAGIFYTGGTTGLPKGVMLSHHAIVMNHLISLVELSVQEEDVLLMSAPLFHLAGLAVMLRSLSRACSIVILPMFTPEGVFRAIQQHRVTSFFAVPVMLQVLAAHPKVSEFDLSSIAFVGYGASVISEPLLDRSFSLFPNARFFQGYGMTELVCSVSNLLGKHHLPEGRAAGLLRSAGRALPCIEVRVVDENDNDVPQGQAGELIVRSPSMMSGYWNRPEETERALRGGWMHTGDAATLDANGFIYIVDRIKDMIVSGGENIYCAEVENALARHPAVAATAVIGVPSKEWGETVHAVVVVKPGSTLTLEDLQAHCKSLIAAYKCPRSIELREALPISAVGKVLKFVLREPHWANQSRRVS